MKITKDVKGKVAMRTPLKMPGKRGCAGLPHIMGIFVQEETKRKRALCTASTSLTGSWKNSRITPLSQKPTSKWIFHFCHSYYPTHTSLGVSRQSWHEVCQCVEQKWSVGASHLTWGDFQNCLGPPVPSRDVAWLLLSSPPISINDIEKKDLGLRKISFHLCP